MARGARLQIEVDRNTCRGAGECVHRAPETFQLDHTHHAAVKQPVGDARETVVAAARACPHFAIAVRVGDERLV